MKKYLVLFFLLASLTSFGQFSNYTNINGRYKWIAGKFDSTFTIPSGTTPSLRTGGGTGPGALFYRTTDSTVYQYTGTQWIKLRAGVSPTDTAGIWLTNVYRKPGSDSVFYVKGGSSTFAFRDSVGNVGGGGGGGKIYYFNGGVNMGTFGGLTMYELGDTAVTGSAANFTRATTGAIANFITDVNKPGLLQIPAGVWTIDAYVSETGGGANHAQIWAVLEKWNGSTITTIATSPIEEITNGSVIDLYTWTISVPTTSIAVTDRIIIQFYITNTNGKTVTLYTQNGYVGEVHTTFTTGIGSLNGLTAPSQFFATGTSGTDFNIASATATHTFNLPTASATNRGALSSADWTTFNSKVGGSGTTNYLSKWTSSSALGNSQIQDNGTSLFIGATSPYINSSTLNIQGTSTLVGVTAKNTSSSSGSTQAGFYVENSVSQGQLYKAGANYTTYKIINGNDLGFYNGSAGDIGILNDVASGRIKFAAGSSSTSQLTIFSNGNVGIGTNLTDAGYRLDVSGTFRSTGDANINGLTVGKGGGSVATNTAVGSSVLTANTTGSLNVGVGTNSLSSNITGLANTAVGYESLKAYNSANGANVAIGYLTSTTNTSGTANTIVGAEAQRYGSSGSNQTALGYRSLWVSTGSTNVAIGYLAGQDLTTGSNNIILGAGGTGVTTGNNNTLIGNVSGLSASLSNTIILADGQGNQRLYIDASGDVGIGGAPSAWSTFTGVLQSGRMAFSNSLGGNAVSYLTSNIYFDGSNFRYIGTGYSFLQGYSQYDGAWYVSTYASGTAGNVLSGGANRMTIWANTGNVLINTTTDAGYKLDVNGTARLNGFVITDGTNKQLQIINDQATSADRGFALYQNNTGIQGAAMMFYKSRGSYAAPSNVASGDIISAFSYRPYITGYPVDQSLMGAVMTSTSGVSQFFITGTTASNYTPNLLLAHNGNVSIGSLGGTIITSLTLPTAKLQVRGSGATSSTTALLIENSSAAVSLFVNDAGQTGIGTSSPNASALLDVSSTTKGFLPPRMTGANAEAIGTPAAGLLVYINNGNGTTITSTGWWGYDGTTWVKLN